MIHQDTLSTEALSDHIDHTYPPSLPVSKPADTNGIGALSSVASDRPFLLVKLTGYRLLSTTVFIAFASGKMVPSLNGSMLASVWLEWGLAGFGGLLLLSLSLDVRPKRAEWFFQKDLAPDILLWPTGFVFIVSAISVSLVLFFAIGLNLAGLACLLPISPATYNMLIVPIVILTDALTAAFLAAVYYIFKRLNHFFEPILRRYKRRMELHRNFEVFVTLLLSYVFRVPAMAYSLSFQIGFGLLACLSLLAMVEAFCIDNRGTDICAWPCKLMIPALSKRAHVSCGFPKPSVFMSSRTTNVVHPIQSDFSNLSNSVAAKPGLNQSYLFFIASRVVIIVALLVYLYNYE